MSVRIGSGLATGDDPRVAAIEAGTDARQALDGARADLVLVFCAGAHLAAPESTLEGVREALDPDVLIGCGAGGVLARGREIERGTAVAVWAASFERATGEPKAATRVSCDRALDAGRRASSRACRTSAEPRRC